MLELNENEDDPTSYINTYVTVLFSDLYETMKTVDKAGAKFYITNPHSIRDIQAITLFIYNYDDQYMFTDWNSYESNNLIQSIKTKKKLVKTVKEYLMKNIIKSKNIIIILIILIKLIKY